MNKQLRVMLFVLVAALLVTSVSGATIGEAFGSVFDLLENFFSGGWQQHEKSLAFMITFLLFFSAFMVGAKKAFGDVNRAVVAFAVTAALLASTILVITSNFTLVKFGFIAAGLLFLMVVAVVHTLLLKMGMEKSGWTLGAAFLIAALLFGIAGAFSSEESAFAPLGAPFRWLDGLGDGISVPSLGGGSSSSGDGFFAKVKRWFSGSGGSSSSSSGDGFFRKAGNGIKNFFGGIGEGISSLGSKASDAASGIGSSSGGSGSSSSSTGTSAGAGTSADTTQKARERAQEILKGEQGGGWFDWWGSIPGSESKLPFLIAIGAVVLIIILKVGGTKTRPRVHGDRTVSEDPSDKAEVNRRIVALLWEKHQILKRIKKIITTIPELKGHHDGINIPPGQELEFIPWLRPPSMYVKRVWNHIKKVHHKPFMRNSHHLYDTIWDLSVHYFELETRIERLLKVLEELQNFEDGLYPTAFPALVAAIDTVRLHLASIQGVLQRATGNQQDLITEERSKLAEDNEAQVDARDMGWVRERIDNANTLFASFDGRDAAGALATTSERHIIRLLYKAVKEQIRIMEEGPDPHDPHDPHDPENLHDEFGEHADDASEDLGENADPGDFTEEELDFD